jgi:hypothetical protein
MSVSARSSSRERGSRDRRGGTVRDAQSQWQASFLIYLLTGLLVIGLGTAVATYLPMP